MRKILSFLSEKIRCPSPFTKELLADESKLIKPTFSRVKKGFYGTILKQPFLIQLCLLLHDKIPKNGEELTPRERIFIKNIIPVYNRYIACKPRKGFMSFSFLADYKKIEKGSTLFSLKELDYFLFLHLPKGIRSILVMSYRNETHYIGVSRCRIIEFYDSLQFFKVKTFKSDQPSNCARAIKKRVIEWASPNADLDDIHLRLMWLENRCREKVQV